MLKVIKFKVQGFKIKKAPSLYQVKVDSPTKGGEYGRD